MFLFGLGVVFVACFFFLEDSRESDLDMDNLKKISPKIKVDREMGPWDVWGTEVWGCSGHILD